MKRQKPLPRAVGGLMAALFLLVFALPTPARAVSAYVAARARARAEGNDRMRAIVLGEVLLATVWPAQVLKVRVDGAGGHRIAGLVLSGTNFHARLDEAGFLREVKALIALAFARAPIEEVDLWVTVPLDAGIGATVSGDMAQPTSHNVFAVTVRRSELPQLGMLLHSHDVFHDTGWWAKFRSQGVI
jgi:hypothetical protein